MKAQTNKCHTFSDLLFINKLSLYTVSSVSASIFIIDKLCNNSRNFSALSYVVTHSTKFLKNSPLYITFSKRITALLIFRRLKISVR